MTGYAFTLFLGAFLLFQVQPLICKQILPWFGGTPAVWTTCMLFFQTLLLCGYAYAHLSIGRLKPRNQGLLHVLLLLASLIFLPVLPHESWKPMGDESPGWRILALLGVHIGAPYFLLSATAPLLQAWYSREHRGLSPYRLYALSNAGSLLGLLSYPFIVEPLLSLRMQSYVWSAIYAGFVLVCGWRALCIFRHPDFTTAASTPEGLDNTGAAASSAPEPSRADHWLWMAFPACGSVLLLATTNQLTQDVAVVPFLWVFPLVLYLLSFILSFDSEIWYFRPFWLFMLPLALSAGAVALVAGVTLDLKLQVALYASSLFVCCMVCHGELARLKPHPRYLTRFYMLISAGGALGGVAVSVAAPLLFDGLWEYPGGLVACALLCAFALFRDPSSRLYRGRQPWAWGLIGIAITVLAALLLKNAHLSLKYAVTVTRNFYGVLRVAEIPGNEPELDGYVLYHGRIKHGFQYAREPRRRIATSYYGLKSGVGVSVRALLEAQAPQTDAQGLRIGVIGLGAGTIATYGGKKDYLRFYEINPEVLRLSKEYFTFRKDSFAKLEIVLGDARVSMERELARGEAQRFDLLVIDAFSGDAIPLYLLTREAVVLYAEHLRPDGIMAFHISNRFLDLRPLVRGLAADSGKEAVQIDSDDDGENAVDGARWVLVSSNRALLESPPIKQETDAWPAEAPEPLIFTDDYSNLLKLLKR